MTRDATPPHDLDAEESLLGAMLLSGDAIDAAYELRVTVGDFHKPDHAAIYRAITDAHDANDGVDATTVGALLAGTEITRAHLLRLLAQTPASANAAGYAKIVKRLARHRRTILYAESLEHAAWQADDARVEKLLAGTATLEDAAITETVDTIGVLELLASPPAVPKPWVVPGLVRHGEVLVLTGGEGAGKMSFLRQCALGVAAGVHPFTGQLTARQSVLIVDLQEDRTDLRGELAKPQYQSFIRMLTQPERLHVASRRGGINLLSHHDARRFEALIQAHEPALVVMGPLKRIYRPPDGKGMWDDDVVEALHIQFDKWQDRYGFALMLEGHAGHDRESWRVKGSSAWYAWPSFGYGLNPVSWHPREVEMKRWRGDRNPDLYPRAWPSKLTEGTAVAWNADQTAIDAMRRAQDRGDDIDQAALLDDEAPF